MINVLNDWQWILNHVKEELTNPFFDGLVRDVLKKPFMDENDIKNLASLYWEGLENGMKNGKYLPFSEWFKEFFTE